MEDDREIQAMSTVNAALKELTEDERYRVIQWVANKYVQNTAPLKLANPTVGGTPAGVIEAAVEDEEIDENREHVMTYDTFAEMLDASNAGTDAERFLIAAFWVQVTKEQPTWKSFEVNKLLKDTGKQISNIGNALRDVSKKSKTQAALVVQVSKNSSSSGKGSKVLKLTSEGIKKAKAMLGQS
jgi:hypothetical protein